MIYDDVLRSDAFKSLPHSARSVYLAIAAQYHGHNNGDLSLPASVAKAYGITHKEMASAVPLLEMTDLLVVTRRGRISGGRGVCSLYGLTFHPIEASDKYDSPTTLQKPVSNAWARWVRPEDWVDIRRQAKRRAAGRKRPTPHVGNEPVRDVWNEDRASRSTRAASMTNGAVPHGEESSRYLGGVFERAAQFIALHPKCSDVEVARSVGWQIAVKDVAEVRKQIDAHIGARQGTSCDLPN